MFLFLILLLSMLLICLANIRNRVLYTENEHKSSNLHVVIRESNKPWAATSCRLRAGNYYGQAHILGYAFFVEVRTDHLGLQGEAMNFDNEDLALGIHIMAYQVKASDEHFEDP